MRKPWIFAALVVTSLAAADPAPETLADREAKCAANDWRVCEGLRDEIRDEPAAARTRYTEACKRGTASACAFLGDWIFEHAIGHGDPETALPWYQRSCRAKSSYGCDRYAWMVQDTPKSTELYDSLCQASWAPACEHYGTRIEYSKLPNAKRRAIEMFGKACDGGVVTGCWRAGLALAYLDDAKPAERTDAWARMDTACTGGDAANCRVLASIYRCGLGTACDWERGDRYKRAADTLDPPRPSSNRDLNALGTTECSCKRH